MTMHFFESSAEIAASPDAVLKERVERAAGA